MNKHILEPAARQFADAAAQPPFLYELDPEGARQVLDNIQAAPIDKLPVQEKWITVPAEVGDVRVRIVRPVGAEETLPRSRPGPGKPFTLELTCPGPDEVHAERVVEVQNARPRPSSDSPVRRPASSRTTVSRIGMSSCTARSPGQR